jgi:hypothetical protein
MRQTTEDRARSIGSARANDDLAAGRMPAGISELDWWHLAEITGSPLPQMPPDEYRILVGCADGGYWSAIDDAIPEQPDTDIAILNENGDSNQIDLSAVRVVPRRWRARMDETLLILLDDAARRHHWTAARFCAAYARLAGPQAAGALFGAPHD